jgi:DMSO/TMAO reductase YedYZ heme-binding membrane subunit
MQYILDILGIILLIPLILFVVYAGKHLHKNENKYYLVIGFLTTVLGILAIIAQVVDYDIQSNSALLYALFFQGHATLPFFILVMFGGAFKKRSKPLITLMKVRRELAIIGFLFLIPHALYLVWLALTNLNPTGTIAFLIMLPLFITSFTKIRKKMHPKEWKRLHKWAYLAYAMIYLHLISITIIFNLMNNSGNDLIWGFIRAGIYTLVFGYYTYLKFKYYILVDKSTPKKEQN